MTLHSKVRAEFNIWDRNNKGKRCGGALKKAFIKDQLIPVYEDLNDTIINKKWNPINSPIYNQKKQDQLRAQYALKLQNVKYNDEAYLGIPAVMVIAENIVKNFSIFESIMTDESISFYILYTARVAAIEGDEWAAFLSGRSGYTMDSEGNHQSKPSNPVLRHTQTSDLYRETCSSDKTIITRTQMKDDLGFKVEVLLMICTYNVLIVY